MNSEIKELYEAAQECVREAYVNTADYTIRQVENALTVIELIEDGKHKQAFNVGFNY